MNILASENMVMFGPLHIIYLVAMVVFGTIAIIVGQKHDEKITRIISLSVGLFLITIEIYKLVYLYFAKGYFNWGYFSFQFCSVPMYIATIAPMVEKKKVQTAMYKFLGLYGTTAGFITMILPSAFSEYRMYIEIIFHSLTWHALLFILGVYMISSQSIYKNFKDDVIEASKVFLVVFSMAIVMNIVSYYAYFGTDKNVMKMTFSMFYVHPFYKNSLPLLSNIQGWLMETFSTWPAFILYVIVYLAVFIGGVSLIYGLIRLVRKVLKYE